MIHVASLIKNPKRRGEWAELRFMTAAAEQGLSVSKPWGDSERYDVGVEHNGQYRRVQVKSLSSRMRHSYCCWVGANAHAHARAYKSSELDFFAILIVPEELWYIVPAETALASGNRSICLTPSMKSNRFEVYRGAWHLLMRQAKATEGGEVVLSTNDPRPTC